MCRPCPTNDSKWVVYLEKRKVWWRDENYEWYFRLLYEGFEQLIVLGAIPLTMLIYFNFKIYKSIRLPPNLEIQAADEILRLSRERKLADVLIIIVCVFIICHSTRISWYVYYTVIYDNMINCPKHHPSLSGESPWTYVYALIYDLFVVINSSVNTIVYCAVNAGFRFHFIRLLKLPLKKIVNIVYRPTSASDTLDQPCLDSCISNVTT